MDGGTTGEGVPYTRVIPFDVPGFQVREYVVPFQDLAGPRGREGSRGFHFEARSAVRLSAYEYVERTTNFWVTFPQSGGGGIVRINEMDFANPHLNFRADVPPVGSSNEEQRDEFRERMSDENLALAFRRVHAGGNFVESAATRRAARIASFQLEPVLDGDPAMGSVPRPPPRQEGSFGEFERRVAEMKPRRDPLPRYMRDLGLDDE